MVTFPSSTNWTSASAAPKNGFSKTLSDRPTVNVLSAQTQSQTQQCSVSNGESKQVKEKLVKELEASERTSQLLLSLVKDQ